MELGGQEGKCQAMFIFTMLLLLLPLLLFFFAAAVLIEAPFLFLSHLHTESSLEWTTPLQPLACLPLFFSGKDS